jgi:hypothetical protein
MRMLMAAGTPAADPAFHINWLQIEQEIQTILRRFYPDQLTIQSVNWHGVTSPAFPGPVRVLSS